MTAALLAGLALPAHYCHNCRHHAELPDGTYCTWCLTFFYRTRKLPSPGDTKPTTLQRLYAELDTLSPAE